MKVNPPAAPPVVRTELGAAQGVWREHRSADGSVSRHAVFLGLPYAAPPVGDARFDAPRPAAPWEGVRIAALYGPTPQRISPYDPPRIPEPSIPGADTLSVNVTTPDPSGAARLPVFVYIHGGGFIGGSPASPWYGGQAFARDGVVTVTISYRLAFEGFGWVDGAVNNRGVRDWLAGLEWVQSNIAAFGGDPSRVTIGGQSAGGSSVMRLLTMPAAAGLFSGVLAISPADAPATVDDARDVSRRIAANLGITPDLAGYSGVDEATVYAARVAGSEHPPADPLVAFVADAADMPALTPAVDGDIIPTSVAGGIADGVGADVSLLIGATAHEFNDSAAAIAGLVAGRDPADVLEAGGLSADLARAMVAREPDRGTAWALGQAFTDSIFRRCVAGWSAARAATGAPTWTYDFRWESRADALTGALHCVDVPFGMDMLSAPGAVEATGPAPQALADLVHGDWLAIIRDRAIDSPQYGPDRATITYRDDGTRAVGPGYEIETRLWDETRR